MTVLDASPRRRWTALAGALALALVASRPAPAFEGAVAAESPLAAEVGVAILGEGGSAVDAAIATALAVCVVNPSSCGIGGGGFMVVWDPAAQRAAALDYREVAPARALPALYLRDGTYDPALSRRGPLAVGVPGEI